MRIIPIGLVAMGLLAGCADRQTSRPAVSVFVSIAPQQYVVERIGGERVTAALLVQPGHSPATYEPSPRQMAELSEARLYFRIGVPFENALIPKIERTMRSVRIVDTRRGITLREMAGRESTGGHGEAGHHHGGTDPHTWLNPKFVMVQARTICEALIEMDPEGREQYEANLQALLGDLLNLDRQIAEALRTVKGRSFLAFHPAWGYFADAYGLEQRSVEIEGKSPSARQLARVIDQAKAQGARVIFVQPQFDRKSAQTVAAAIGAVVIAIDPMAKDYIGNMQSVALQMERALSGQRGK